MGADQAALAEEPLFTPADASQLVCSPDAPDGPVAGASPTGTPSAAQAANVFGHYTEPPETGGVAGFLEGAASTVWHDLTDWHFEGRDAKNGTPPDEDQLKAQGSGWTQLPPSMAIFHDNGVGAPERKYVNPDGRESVKDGDTGQEMTDPKYKATYNYVTPMTWDDAHGVGGVAEFAMRNTGHFFADVVPYLIGGNVRGPG